MWLALALALSAAPLTFDEAVARAAETPAVRAAEHAATLQRASADRVPLLTLNPTLAAQPGVRVSPSLEPGPEVQASVSLGFNLSGHGPARQKAARADAELTRMQRTSLVRAARLAAAFAWTQAWAAQTKLALAKAELDAAAAWAGRVERAAAAGAIDNAERAGAQAYRGEAEVVALHSEGASFEAGLELARVLGVAADEPLAVLGAPPVTPTSVDGTAALPRAPAVLEAQAALEAEKAAGAEAWASRGHVLQLVALGAREGTGDVVATLGLQWTFPLFDRGERERGVHAAAVARAEGAVVQAEAEARVSLAVAAHEVEHKTRELEAVEVRWVPAARAAAQGQRALFDAGEATAWELMQARRAQLSAEQRLAEARAELAYAAFRLAELSRVEK